MNDGRTDDMAPKAVGSWRGESLYWLIAYAVLAASGVLHLFDESRSMQTTGGLTAAFAAMMIGSLLVTRKTGRPTHPLLWAAMIGVVGVIVLLSIYNVAILTKSLMAGGDVPPG